MDPIHPKFYHASFEVISGTEVLVLKGLISEQGITKVFIPSPLPEFWKSKIGQTVSLKIDGLILSAVLLQQFVEHGTYFEFRFRDLEEPHRNYIRQRITVEGISPGWLREHPRIPVSKGADADLPVISLCMVRFVGQEIFVDVKNFTLGGLRIETFDNNLAEVRVGAVLHFDLLASNGAVMANLSGEVRNMTVHEIEQDGRKLNSLSFGLRLMEMDPLNERKYRDLIRDYCLLMQKIFSEEA